MGKTYSYWKEDEWVELDGRGLRLSCCDCGLVHDIDYKNIGGTIWLRLRRNERSTGQVRRYKKRRKKSERS